MFIFETYKTDFYAVVSFDGQKLEMLDDTLDQPNGLVGTPDGKYLYVAEAKANRILRYDIQPDGHLTNRLVFADMGSDGMTIDNRGNIYVTGKGVTVFNMKGEKIAHFPIPEGWTSNVCFGGKDRNILFITAFINQSPFTCADKATLTCRI